MRSKQMRMRGDRLLALVVFGPLLLAALTCAVLAVTVAPDWWAGAIAIGIITVFMLWGLAISWAIDRSDGTA